MAVRSCPATRNVIEVEVIRFRHRLTRDSFWWAEEGPMGRTNGLLLVARRSGSERQIPCRLDEIAVNARPVIPPMSDERQAPWWEDPNFDWTSGNPGVLLGLLATSYPEWTAIEAFTRATGCGFQPEPDPVAPAAELWQQALRRAAETRFLPALLERVLADQATDERRPLFASLRDSLLSSPAQPDEGPIDGLQAITSAGAGLGDAIACVQAMMNLIWRTAAIRVNGHENGTGFLVGDNLLLTAAHVVEAAKRETGRPGHIAAVFDFTSSSGNSYAEAGAVIPVDGIICDSPPAPWERGLAVGDEREASPASLDFALLQLAEPAPKVRAADGSLIGRGCYVLDPDSYDFGFGFGFGSMFIIAQYPLGDFLKFSYITQPPRSNRGGTRITYLGNALRGSSGGPVVDTRGNLVALHHYSNRRENQGVPASAIARHLENSRFAGLFETSESAGPSHFGTYSAEARQKVCEGIANDCEMLARALGTPVGINDAYSLWDWLATHRTLYKLRRALVRLGFEDLAHVLDYDLIKIDRPTIDNIGDGAGKLILSIMPARAARTAAALLASTTVARHRAAILRTQLASLPALQKHPLLALQWRMNWSEEFTRADTALGNLTRTLPRDKNEAHRSLKGIENMIKYARETESAAVALTELARSPALSL
jgi:hypothetical protein